jgi:phage host-nuclease inhibitor protein Gam
MPTVRRTDDLDVNSWPKVDYLLSCMRRIDNAIAKVTAARDQAIAKAAAPFGKKLDDLGADRAKLEAAMTPFCEEHKGEVAPAKSRKLDSGTIGWRAADAKLELLNESKDWPTAKAKILLAIAEREPFKHWIRTEPELARDAILLDAKSGKADAATLRRFDLKLGGGADVFYVKPKSDPTRDREADAPEE